MEPVHLAIAPVDRREGSRVGGNPPRCFAGDTLVETHDYLLTLAASAAEWLLGRELSVFVRRGFTIGDDDLEYPDIGVHAVLHEPSGRGDGIVGRHPGLGSAALISAPVDAEEAPFVRIARDPVLIQNEPSYAHAVEADGYQFLFQVNEEGWPVSDAPDPEFVEEYLFGYGSVYFYGRLDSKGAAQIVVPGFLDF
ncbi:hypothetical protein DEU38_120122 [Rhodococcus sp. AG1013]|uniref:hypothetical protein n=1 Tax=Rhodococcus sp. AG1013 TaxID=2183996 RepID=UPI000E0C2107|nr:hypothetical protein [Rhodococcus sp. AG1013]RDI18553.1 hypothetical protein DEU38_120122 [Rhodococcus sp. AG1013]